MGITPAKQLDPITDHSPFATLVNHSRLRDDVHRELPDVKGEPSLVFTSRQGGPYRVHVDFGDTANAIP